jgi:hypothetical protein
MPKLSDTKIRGAKPKEKPYKLFDGDGLFLIVHPNGGRWWRQRYYLEGKEQLPWKLTPYRGRVSTKAIERRRGYFSGCFCRLSLFSACSRMSANEVLEARVGIESTI